MSRKSVLVSWFHIPDERYHWLHCSISSTTDDDPVKNQIAKALVTRITQAARDGQKFKPKSLEAEGAAQASEFLRLNRSHSLHHYSIRPLYILYTLQEENRMLADQIFHRTHMDIYICKDSRTQLEYCQINTITQCFQQPSCSIRGRLWCLLPHARVECKATAILWWS